MNGRQDGAGPPATGERGQVVFLVAIAMVILMGFLAMIIDVGMAYAQRRQMQNAADGAAVAGARVIALQGVATSDADVQQEIDRYVQLNGAKVDYSALPPYYITPDGSTLSPVGAGGNIPASAKGVLVTADNLQPLNTFFASMLGHPVVDVNARAATLAFAAQMPLTNPPGLVPLTVPQAAITQGASQIMWGPQYASYCSDFGYDNVPMSMKGILDFNNGAGPNYQQGSNCGNKPNCANQWTQNGFDGTIGTNDWIGYFNGDLGHNVASALTTRLDNQQLSDSGGDYGILYLPIWDLVEDRPSIGTAFHIVGFGAFKVYTSDVAGSSASGQFISWVVPGGQIDTSGGTTPGPRVLKLVPPGAGPAPTPNGTPTAALPTSTSTPSPTATGLAGGTPTAASTVSPTPTGTPVRAPPPRPRRPRLRPPPRAHRSPSRACPSTRWATRARSMCRGRRTWRPTPASSGGHRPATTPQVPPIPTTPPRTVCR